MEKAKHNKKKIFIYLIIFLGVLIVVFASKFILIPKLTITKDIDALSLWLEIYGGIVALFMVIAFINMFVSKKEFDNLKKELEKKSTELDNNYREKINKINIISDEQNNKLIKYEDTIKSKTNFIMNYTRYLTSKGKNNLELIKLFEDDLLFNESQEIYEILTNLYFNEIDNQLGLSSDVTDKQQGLNFIEHYKQLTKKRKINMDLFKKGINYINEWLIYRVDNDEFDYGLLSPIFKLQSYMEIIIEQKSEFYNTLDTNITSKLEEVRKNFMQDTDITDYEKRNITPVHGNFITYTSFLEKLIDLQICYGIYGSNVLINQYIELLEIQYSIIILSETQKNNNKSKSEKTDKTNSESFKKYMDDKKSKYNLL